MKLTPFGAAGEVTGSCTLVEAGKTRLLIDCGLFQGMQLADERNREPFLFEPKKITALVITHAHLDHTGRIPALVRQGFRGKIYATQPTFELAELLWTDTLHIMREEAERNPKHQPLYDEQDIKKVVKQFSRASWGKTVTVAPGVTATFHDAGHILGSSFVELKAGDTVVVFSGDVGNRDVPLMHPTERLPAADLLVCEATYGDRLHENQKERLSKLRSVIAGTVKRRGVLMIPAFAFERTQELLYDLNFLVEKKYIPRVPIFLDSPMGIRATEIFKKSRSFYNTKAACIVDCGDDFFQFPGLKMTLSRQESMTINTTHAPKIIIAGSGMMNGGRILHHLRRYLPDRKSTVLVVGYQAAGTLGRKIFGGAKSVIIHNNRIPVRARVEAIGAYSAHADQEKLLGWIKAGMPKQVLVNHSDAAVGKVFQKTVSTQLGIPAAVATANKMVEV